MDKLTHYKGIRVEAFGDWRRARNFTRTLSPTIMASVLWGQEKAAKQLVRIVKGHILHQTMPPGVTWEPLADSTISKKGNSDFFLDSRAYYESITTWRSAYTFYAGVKRGIKNEKGIEIAKLALILENGTDKIPARPLWAPSLEEIGGFDGMRAIVLGVIEAKLLATKANTFTVKRLNSLF